LALEGRARDRQEPRHHQRRQGAADELQEAREIGEAVRERILPKLEPDKRIFSDLTVTDKPDDMTLFKDEDEQWKNYSVSYEWLKEFSDFCLRSKGFQVF
jgi:hypothetical protein